MLFRNYMKGLAVLALVSVASQTAAAQAKPYSLDDVIEFVKGDVAAASILSRVRGACINFKVTDAVADRLRGQGAGENLVDGLRSVCYKGSAKEVDTPPVRPRPVTPRVVHDTVVVPRERVVVKHDTVVLNRPVVPTPYTPTTTTTTTTTGSSLVNWDFHSSQPLTSGRFGKCQYDYDSGGYTISVAENGSPCLDGAPNELESNVRISTSATPVRGSAGYNYGLRFGVSDDSTVGYYALEVSTLGHYQLSRFRNHNWEIIFPWKTGTGINATTTNLITVEIRGTMLTFIINGIQQTTWQTPVPVTGRAGFGIFGYSDDTPYPVVSFASFSETSLAAPTVTPTTSATYVDWDFRSSQPLTSGRFGKCQYDYSSSGYTISVAENGSTCIDGPLGDQPASVRISTTALPIHGTTGYTYGIRFGYTTDETVGYYAFEVSEGGSFHLSRYRQQVWESIIPWTKVSAINAASANSYNTMMVDVRGTSITLYVNGTQVGSFVAPVAPVGPAGFGIIGYSPGDPLPMVTFTRFSVSPL
jgi:hypothetical protein